RATATENRREMPLAMTSAACHLRRLFMKSYGSLTLALSFSLAASSLAADAPAKAPEPVVATPPVEVPAAPQKPFVLPDPVAVVEGVAVKKSELEEAFNGFLASQGVPTGQLPDEQRAEGYRMVLDDLIIEKLI